MSLRVRLLCVALALAAGVAAALALWIAAPLPPALADPGPIPSVTLLDRSGVLLRTTRAPDGTRGGFIPLGEIDPKVLQAFIAMEDRRFYDHGGVEVRALVRALRDDIRAGRVVAGGSTITMQLARLLRGTPRSAIGKVRQILWAWRLEAHLDKHRILELYLNRVPLGQGASGVAAAAALYFDADARNLSLGQAALLGALARAPSRDNPLAAPERARARRALTLRRLVDLGYARPSRAPRGQQDPFRITSPRDGDGYAIPVGGDARYATLALRAAGSGSELGVRWFVDGRETREPRWRLAPGPHTIRAETARGERAEARIEVDSVPHSQRNPR